MARRCVKNCRDVENCHRDQSKALTQAQRKAPKTFALPKSSPDLGQCKETPQDIGYYQRPDAGGHKRAEGSFHQVGEDTGDENEEEWDGGEKKSSTGDVGMGHAESDEKQRDQQRSSIAEVAGARPG